MKRRDSLIEFMPRQVINRHWVWVCLWCAAGVILASQTGATWTWFGPLCMLSGLLLLYLPVILPRRSYWAIAFLTLGMGMLLYGWRRPDDKADPLHQLALTYPQTRLIFDGEVVQAPLYFPERDYMSFVMEVDCADASGAWRPLSGKAVVRWKGANLPLFPGMRVRTAGRLTPHLGPVNLGVRGIEDMYRSWGIFSAVHASARGVEILSERRWSLWNLAARFRQWQSEQFRVIMPPSVFAFINGVWLGERALIDDDQYQQFMRAGTAHVLSVSGVHVAIITFSLGFLLTLLRLPTRIRMTLMVGGVLIFALMTGASTATLRSALMVMIYLAYEAQERETDSLSVLGLSGVIFMVWNPNHLFDAGFLLSFGSVGSILLFYPGTARLFAFLPKAIAGMLATTCSVQIVSAPMAVWFFHLLPLTGVLANLVVVPLLSLSLWLCFAAVLLSAIFPAGARIVGYALYPIVSLIQWTNESAASLPAAYLSVLRPSWLALFLYAVGALFLFRVLYEERARKHNGILMTALFLSAALLWNVSWNGRGEGTVDIIDVGHGDSILIRTPGGTTALVDGGDCSEESDAGARIVTPFLRANRIKRLDYVVVSHNHRDHIGGLSSVVQEIPVGKVILGPERKEPGELEQQFIAVCDACRIPIQRVQAGDRLLAAGASMEVLHPTPTWASQKSENNLSVAILLSWPGFSMLLPGDMEEPVESALTPTLPRGIDILKTPHHGSPTSSSVAFLQHLAPRAATISTRAPDARGPFMPDAMMDRYEELSIPVFRTNYAGGVRIIGDGREVRVVTGRGVRGYDLAPRPGFLHSFHNP